MVNSHWYPQTHTFNIQGSKYSILDVHSILSKHNVGCSNGSEIPALTEDVTLEIDVCTTYSWNMTKCFNALHHCSTLQWTIFQSWRFLGWTFGLHLLYIRPEVFMISWTDKNIEFISYIYILYCMSIINFQLSYNLAGFLDILNYTRQNGGLGTAKTPNSCVYRHDDTRSTSDKGQ